MKKIDVREIKDNLVEIIGDEWMLVTAGTKEKFNMMTANWGGMGYLWHKPVVFVFVRPERYTYEFTESQDLFTLSFLGEENKDIHKICGSKSGRNVDKVKETGLVPLETENGSITFEQARITLECRKLYTEMIKKENFLDQESFQKWYSPAKGNPHKMYIAEVLNVWVKE
ncbi:MAG: flavin reductase family protein [Tannerellaceae bacterium]|nr:flavin reductase family protein [Tannerellaceae bacterium]